jgi:hypothetical protein
MSNTTTPKLTIVERATKIIADTYAEHGTCTLLCDCGAWEVAVTMRTKVVQAADVVKVRDLIEHARYDHATPHSVIVVVYHHVLNTADL